MGATRLSMASDQPPLSDNMIRIQYDSANASPRQQTSQSPHSKTDHLRIDQLRIDQAFSSTSRRMPGNFQFSPMKGQV